MQKLINFSEETKDEKYITIIAPKNSKVTFLFEELFVYVLSIELISDTHSYVFTREDKAKQLRDRFLNVEYSRLNSGKEYEGPDIVKEMEKYEYEYYCKIEKLKLM